MGTPFSGSDKAQYVSVTSGDQTSRWEEARDAAQGVIDLGASRASSQRLVWSPLVTLTYCALSEPLKGVPTAGAPDAR